MINKKYATLFSLFITAFVFRIIWDMVSSNEQQQHEKEMITVNNYKPNKKFVIVEKNGRKVIRNVDYNGEVSRNIQFPKKKNKSQPPKKFLKGHKKKTHFGNKFEVKGNKKIQTPSQKQQKLDQKKKKQQENKKERNATQSKSVQYRKNRNIFFMHLHKAAGTTICVLAVSNGLRAAGIHSNHKLGYNCNIRGDDPGHLGLGEVGQESELHQAEGNFTCENRTNFMRRHHLQFTAIERWIFPHEICLESFIYVTVLRDPFKRMESSVKYHTKQTEGMLIKWATNHTFFPNAPISSGSSAVDNYYVRSFAGREVFLKELGSINNDDLAQASKILDMFEVIIILENFKKDRVQLRRYLNWPGLVVAKGKQSPVQKQCHFNNNQINFLKQINLFDYEFYKYAQILALNRTR